MKITLVSDIICPWCYVGKRRIERAIKDLDIADKVDIEISPYALSPEIPSEGKPISNYQSKGDIIPTLIEAGTQLGIDFRFDLIKRIPNTLLLHALMMEFNLEDRVVLKEHFLAAFFTQGIDLSEEASVSDVIDLAGLRQISVTEKMIANAEISISRNQDRGVRVVPSFIIDDEHIISGAIESARWRQFFSKYLSDNS